MCVCSHNMCPEACLKCCMARVRREPLHDCFLLEFYDVCQHTSALVARQEVSSYMLFGA